MSLCSAQQVLDISRQAIEIFACRGLKCCLVGSVASYAYGAARTPNDVDLVVLTSLYGQEELKAMLVQAEAKFYLVRSRNVYATYKVLWYRASTFSSCKVDVLIPGIMNIPNVPRQHIISVAPYHLPLMPLIPHLLLKLQAWSDHRNSHRSDQRLKQYTDVRDIEELLRIARRQRHYIRSPDLSWIPETMIIAAIARLRVFNIDGSSTSKESWRRLGFNV